MAESKIVKGKKYYSKSDNIVDIFAELHSDNDEGRPTVTFEGRVAKTIKGHDSLLNKIQRFTAEGKWLNAEGVTVDGSIHDLKEEHVEPTH